MINLPLWVDEAESSINALTILDHGVPVDNYLGMPIYENTLSEPWTENAEYEFRDSSYSPKGLAVYHGWLPLYAIAGAEAIAGFKPDRPQDSPTVIHGADSFLARTVVPRIPAVLFSLGFMVTIFLAASEIAGSIAGLAALTWVALGEHAVSYGHQARYYSLTLFLSALFILMYFRVLRHGKMRDFCLLGVVVGLLFHSHQLSAFVAGAVAVCGAWHLRVHPDWLKKSIFSVMSASALVVPWVVFSGFLHTYSAVPKTYTLFDGWQDWTRYLFTHSMEAAFGLAGFLLIMALEHWRSRRPTQQQTEPHLVRKQVTVAFLWVVCGLIAFHTLIPAASFFTGRLTLMLLTPYVLLVSVAVGLLTETLLPRFSAAAAVLLTILIHLTLGHLAKFRDSSGTDAQLLKTSLTALSSRGYERGTRFFAPPNDHLLWTYYSGLPVQSIAPLRKTFLDDYPFPIIYLERRTFNELASIEQVREAATQTAETVTTDEADQLRQRLWRLQVIGDLSTEGLRLDAEPPLPHFMDPVAKATRSLSLRKANAHMRYFRNHPMFQGVADLRNPSELWFTFFYRFAHAETRLGVNSNFYARLAAASVTLLPHASLAIYESPAPTKAPANKL